MEAEGKKECVVNAQSWEMTPQSHEKAIPAMIARRRAALINELAPGT
jgi:hypothetical protein